MTASEKLSTTDAETLAARVAQVSGAGMSLSAGLRAAAGEAHSRRLALVLRQMAQSVEQGTSLSQAIETHGGQLPPHIAGVMQAADNSGRLGSLLAEWIENQRAARAHRREVAAALAYPAVTLGLALAVLIFFSQAVVPQFGLMFREFGLRLAPATEAFLWFGETGVEILTAILAALAVIALGIRVLGGRAGWSQAVTFVPVVGNLWHWSGVAEMLRVLGLLVDERLDLAKSLRAAGQGNSDAHVGRVCQRLAADVERGLPLWRAILESRALPLSIVPLVRWGEKGDMLGDALRTAAEMLEGRQRSGSQVLVTVLPPLVFIGVVAMVASILGNLMLPMISLIQGLT
jgi:type II secretory pathway component PulF